MFSITGKELSYWSTPASMLHRYCDLLGLTDIGRTKYYFTAVELDRDVLQKIDSMLRDSMAGVEGTLVTKYSSIGKSRRGVRGEYLEDILRSNELSDTFHDLRFKFTKGQCQVHLILSRRKVQFRFHGTALHESLKRELKKSIKDVLEERRARFMRALASITIFMFLSFILMWLAEWRGARSSTLLMLNIMALLSTAILLPVMWTHYKGTYLPHTTIRLTKSDEQKRKLDIGLIIASLSLLAEVVSLIIELLSKIYGYILLPSQKVALEDGNYGKA
jgi:hypothetical protein